MNAMILVLALTCGQPEQAPGAAMPNCQCPIKSSPLCKGGYCECQYAEYGYKCCCNGNGNIKPEQAPPVDRPAQAPPVKLECECPVTGVCACKSCICIQSYSGGCDKAAKENKTLVVFVGSIHQITPRGIPGLVCCRAVSLPGYPKSCIVVAEPKNGQLDWKATLGVNAGNLQIRTADHRVKEVSSVPATNPFLVFHQPRQSANC